MTTPHDDPPRGGTPLDDALSGSDAGDEPLVGGSDGAADGAADGGAVQDDPTTEGDEDSRFA
jgi:hypothetical protein